VWGWLQVNNGYYNVSTTIDKLYQVQVWRA
jgi:hypothetical protein